MINGAVQGKEGVMVATTSEATAIHIGRSVASADQASATSMTETTTVGVTTTGSQQSDSSLSTYRRRSEELPRLWRRRGLI